MRYYTNQIVFTVCIISAIVMVIILQQKKLSADVSSSKENWYALYVKSKKIGWRCVTIAETKDEIKTTEKVFMYYGDREISMSSEVTYSSSQLSIPKSASCTTKVGEVIIMEGNLKFQKDRAIGKAELKADDNGNPKKVPEKREQKFDIKRDIVLIQPAMEFIMPKLFSKADTFNITFIEFPDDVDGLANFKDYNVVREKTNSKGIIELKLLHRDDVPVFIAEIDSKGDCVLTKYGEAECRKTTKDEALKMDKQDNAEKK